MSVILASYGYDATIRFWEALDGVCSRSIQTPDYHINRLEITSDKKYLAAAGNTTINIYDIRNKNSNPVSKLEGHVPGSNINSISFATDNQWMVSASDDGTIKVWDIRSNKIESDCNNGSPINDLSFNRSSSEAITCDQEGRVKIWDIGMKRAVHVLEPGNEHVNLLSVTAAQDSSVIIAANKKGQCFVWSMDRNKGSYYGTRSFTAHNTYITRCLLSSDRKYLATCSADHSAKVWNLDNDFSLVQSLTGHAGWVWDCAFSADSAYLVTGSSDNMVRLWELGTSKIIRKYQGHQKAVCAVALNDV
ncbi:TOR complex subunit LST8 [Ascoidea rubescens DSM 1968]|uniref:Putative intracellular transport protein n=1 Tax=Ascoidea rubescens DSM 1968 TaxID=1344418 RepID=A0A1D2VIB6_9ASCO|nr:putative intracellular transport protein [Ascoidea rubescens DSM 1968]ODV61270.1 putative intracellular transport protein [Ascoidea rubescens DSM 1968]